MARAKCAGGDVRVGGGGGGGGGNGSGSVNGNGNGSIGVGRGKDMMSCHGLKVGHGSSSSTEGYD